MTVWRTFHSINEDLAFCLGLSLNLLLLVLIKEIKIKLMQKYNILLFQCCCIDLLQVFITFIVKPVIVISQKNAFFLSNGFLQNIGGSIEMLGIVCSMISLYFCVCSMPVSYIFRYRTLCLNAEISGRFYVISLLVALFSASTFGIIVWKFHYLDNQNLTYLGEANLTWLMADDEGKVKIASVCFAGSLGMLLTIIDGCLILFVPYSIMIICNIQIMKYFKHHQDSLTAACRRVQTDLNRILLAQAIIPIFSVFIPMMIHFLSTITYWDFTFAAFVGGILNSWIPVGNAISVLFFVTAYREKLKQLVHRIKSQLFFYKRIFPTITADV